jgi:ectoine hydroxylase-related dioxygenase (phytanoyl-CoA dioxygenase family)
VLALTPAQQRSFRDNGFLVIPGFFSESEVSAVQGAYASVWRDLPKDVVVDTEVSMRRVRARDLTEQERRQPFKINDLYLRDVGLREATLSERLGAILRQLLADDPVICNTLSLEYGSQQADHLDTLFMTPRTDGRLVATWMALEDVQPDAGPLRYYPESNHIEPYRFRTAASTSTARRWTGGATTWPRRSTATAWPRRASWPSAATCSSGTPGCCTAAARSARRG